MTIGRGRVIRGPDLPDAVTPLARPPVASAPPRGRIVRRELVLAEARARRILAAAEAEAQSVVESARRAAAGVRLSAEAEGRADGVAAVAARAIALSALEAQADERQLDRVVDLSRLLAERLLGEALRLDPAKVAALAKQTLREARGARSATISAHPEDAAILERLLGELGLELGASIAVDTGLARGNLRVDTEIGQLDAGLAPQLERLARRLRESLKR